jgi:Tfp pilus assembly protein PilV
MTKITNKKTIGFVSGSGFTIIETLVAITILMIAIVGPITIANKALSASVEAKNQMIASNLATEAIEYLKSLKDGNIRGAVDWLTGFGNCTKDGTSGSGACGVQVVSEQPNFNVAMCDSIATGCQLYINPNTGYVMDSSSGNTPTPFTRYVFIGKVSTYDTSYSDVLVTAVVQWNTGPVPSEVRIQTLMTSSPR